MKKRYLLIAGGVDKKGIVYGLSSLLSDHDFNIEDSSMLMLRRTFSVIMLLSNDKGPDEAKFGRDLAVFMKKNSMTADIRQVSEKEMKEYGAAGDSYMITISGADKPGIVKAMTGILYKAGANILDLETKSTEKTKPHAYYMFLEVDLPKNKNMKKIEAALKKQGDKIGVHVAVNRVEKSIL
jgi:glycine cleavage system transcriptional repressor